MQMWRAREAQRLCTCAFVKPTLFNDFVFEYSYWITAYSWFPDARNKDDKCMCARARTQLSRFPFVISFGISPPARLLVSANRIDLFLPCGSFGYSSKRKHRGKKKKKWENGKGETKGEKRDNLSVVVRR